MFWREKKEKMDLEEQEWKRIQLRRLRGPRTPDELKWKCGKITFAELLELEKAEEEEKKKKKEERALEEKTRWDLVLRTGPCTADEDAWFRGQFDYTTLLLLEAQVAVRILQCQRFNMAERRKLGRPPVIWDWMAELKRKEDAAKEKDARMKKILEEGGIDDIPHPFPVVFGLYTSLPMANPWKGSSSEFKVEYVTVETSGGEVTEEPKQ